YTETGLQHEGNVVEVVADVCDFEIFNSRLVQDFREGSLLLFTSLNDERHAKTVSAFLHGVGSSSRDDARFQASSMQELEAEAVACVKAFLLFAILKQPDTPVGQYPITIHQE